jgi:hypothetical protein
LPLSKVGHAVELKTLEALQRRHRDNADRRPAVAGKCEVCRAKSLDLEEPTTRFKIDYVTAKRVSNVDGGSTLRNPGSEISRHDYESGCCSDCCGGQR